MNPVCWFRGHRWATCGPSVLQCVRPWCRGYVTKGERARYWRAEREYFRQLRKRRALLALGLLLVLSGVLAAQSRDVVIDMGTLNASDHELDAGGTGYFALGQGTAIVVKSGGSGWLHLKDLRGKRITLIARVE